MLISGVFSSCEALLTKSLRLNVCWWIFSNASLNFSLTLLISSSGCPVIAIFLSKLSICKWSRNQSKLLSFLSDDFTKTRERRYAIAQKRNIKYILIHIKFFCTTMCGVTFVTINWFPIFLYIKNISSIFVISFRRWSSRSVCHSGLLIAKISASGSLFFPSTIFCAIIGFCVGGKIPCCLLYQFWKKNAFAKILNNTTCNTVNSVNFKLICVEVLSWENENIFCMVVYVDRKMYI